MSIYGIGVDQVDLKRVKRLLNKSEDKFLKRCFTEQEIKYAKRFSDPSKRLGARFAAKEAVMKSLGKGWREISWKDIEVTGGGKPTINTFGRASATVKEKNITNIHISLSHENENAIAFAISEKRELIMRWVGMFPGQGSQEIGMGNELLEKYDELLINTFEETLGWSLKDIINSEDPELIKKTNIAQPYIFSVSYCYGIETINNLGNPAALIGHSLGEYTALCLSGYLDFKDTLKVIAVRGEEMQKAVENSNTTMAAVLTSDLETTIEEIEKLNNQGIQIWISNFNDPSQIVISSYIDDMNYLKSNPKALGAKRVIPLEVAGAFHTEIVSSAKKPLEDTLNEIDISKGNIPVYMNVDAKKVEVSTLKENLVNQIDSSVLFNQQIEYVNKDIDPDLWCHIGPGNVTAGMVRKSISYKDLKVINSLESSK